MHTTAPCEMRAPSNALRGRTSSSKTFAPRSRRRRSSVGSTAPLGRIGGGDDDEPDPVASGLLPPLGSRSRMDSRLCLTPRDVGLEGTIGERFVGDAGRDAKWSCSAEHNLISTRQTWLIDVMVYALVGE